MTEISNDTLDQIEAAGYRDTDAAKDGSMSNNKGHEGAVELDGMGALAEAFPPTQQEPEPTPEPVILKTRTLLRDTFMRLWRCGQQMQPEGIAIVMLCPECNSMIQLGLQGAQVVELKCNCTLWSIRAIHI